MNTTIQTILVLITASLALGFLVRKYFWKPKNKTSKACGNDSCGCG